MAGSWRMKRNYTLSKTRENSQLLVAWLDPPVLSWGPWLGENYKWQRFLMIPSFGFPCLNEGRKLPSLLWKEGTVPHRALQQPGSCLNPEIPVLVLPPSPQATDLVLFLPWVTTGAKQGQPSMEGSYKLCLIPKNLALNPFRNDKIPSL